MKKDYEYASDKKQGFEKRHSDNGRSVIRGPKSRDTKTTSDDKNSELDGEKIFDEKYGDKGQ